jgi:hypothetical protein
LLAFDAGLSERHTPRRIANFSNDPVSAISLIELLLSLKPNLKARQQWVLFEASIKTTSRFSQHHTLSP